MIARFLKICKFEYLLFFVFFIFSWLLMWKTFSTDSLGNMQIATKAWSDFAATIPLIRSFSLGSNFPPQYPIFAGPHIRYHFVFFWVVGMLEKIGLPISWALNIPSILAFTLLLITIYYFGRIVFKSKAVGILSVIFFIFNGSLSFLEYFKIHPFNFNSIIEITKTTTFNSFGPYDSKIVSAFWNLNIYTNQRHLALAYACFMLIILYLYKISKQTKQSNLKQIITVGILIGIFPFIHYAVFGMFIVLLGVLFLFFSKIRKQLFIIGTLAILLAIPQILYMGPGSSQVKLFQPGYLIDVLTLNSFIRYWTLNLGLTIILAPIGFLLGNKDQRKLFIPFLALFIIGNLFKFSPEIAANHKFFNLFIIGANAYSAFTLVTIWRKSLFLIPIVIISVFFLTLSGIFDIFPIMNDRFITIEDIPNNKMSTFIRENTPKNAVFLNSSYLYNPASLAGRKIMMGWPYFAWSAGYDTDSRGKLMTKIYKSSSRSEICRLLKQNSISYFTVQDTTNDNDFPIINLPFFHSNFSEEFSDNGISLISVDKNCL
jgi:hypothetical protein